MRTTPGKRKLRKANDSVLGPIHAEKTQRATPRETRRLIEHNQSSLFCARDLHAAAAAHGVLRHPIEAQTVQKLERCPRQEQSDFSTL